MHRYTVEPWGLGLFAICCFKGTEGFQSSTVLQGELPFLLLAPPSDCLLSQTRYFQPPSVCVNAAGITQDDFLLNMEEDHFDRVIQVNLKVHWADTESIPEELFFQPASTHAAQTMDSETDNLRLPVCMSSLDGGRKSEYYDINNSSS